MKLLLDSFWRAAAYCVLPRVIGLSLLPVAIAAALSLGLGFFFWEGAVAAVDGALRSWSLVDTLLGWVESTLGTGFRAVVAPLVVVALAMPLVLMVSLLLVAVLMTPSIVSLVAERRFAQLERRHGAGLWQSALWSLGCAGVALLALVVSVPLWLVPPLALLLPPLIWGWLTMKVLSFDVLAVHASVEERRRLLREHRGPLWAMGIIAGYLGAAPSLIWAAGAMTLVLAPLLVVVSVWLYTLVFAFAALWFAHYALAALEADRAALRAAETVVEALEAVPPAQAAPPPLPPALPAGGGA